MLKHMVAERGLSRRLVLAAAGVATASAFGLTGSEGPRNSALDRKQRIQRFLKDSKTLIDLDYRSPLIGGNWINPRAPRTILT